MNGHSPEAQAALAALDSQQQQQKKQAGQSEAIEGEVLTFNGNSDKKLEDILRSIDQRILRQEGFALQVAHAQRRIRQSWEQMHREMKTGLMSGMGIIEECAAYPEVQDFMRKSIWESAPDLRQRLYMMYSKGGEQMYRILAEELHGLPSTPPPGIIPKMTQWLLGKGEPGQ